MFSKVYSSAVHGVEAHLIDVEVSLNGGEATKAIIVGLPDTAVRESKDRVMSALSNSGFHAGLENMTINLAPADVRKMGSSFDLPIAIGILLAEFLISPETTEGICILGELALDGVVRPVRGALAAATMAASRRLKGLIVPIANAQEAGMVQGLHVYGVNSLAETAAFLRGEIELAPVKTDPAALLHSRNHHSVDFADVKGQEHVKRALEVAAAGGHNVLMIGPPGSGKTLMARRIPTILPDLTLNEALETTKIHSMAGLLKRDQGLVAIRPFRAPHHTISDAGLIGGGTYPMPGEACLAHHGVLFLDELPEFRRNVLEVLRQPLEDGFVTIARALTSVTYPAQFMLVAAMNPCPCGYLGARERACSCHDKQILAYRSRISGPLLDRIDIHIEVDTVDWEALRRPGGGENSAAIRDRVVRARQTQIARYADLGLTANGQMPGRLLTKYCPLDAASANMLEVAVRQLGLSARAHDRVLRLARTIADLENSIAVQSVHLAEAIQYRSLDRRYDPAENSRRKLMSSQQVNLNR